MKHALAICITLCLLSACSSTEGPFRDRLYDYRKSQETPRMELPAGYSDAGIVDYYPVPPLSKDADQALIINVPLPPDLLIDAAKKVRIQRLGVSQWVLVQASPSQLWPRLKQFVEQHNLPIVQEQGSQGMLLVTSAQGFYRFQVRQGFQRHSSELAIRYSEDASIANAWPAQSANQDKETDLLAEFAQYVANTQEDSYSFLANNISLEKRLIKQTDANGYQRILLKASALRAYASLEAALERGGFTVINKDDKSLLVQFTPQNQNAKKPGFWARLFRIKAKPYDENVPYAGQYYRFHLTAEGQYQAVQLQCVDKDGKAIEQEKKQINQQLDRIEGVLI